MHDDGSLEDLKTVENNGMAPPKPAEVSWNLSLSQGSLDSMEMDLISLKKTAFTLGIF